MMKQQTFARVYRFHDAVAFTTDDSTETAYLSVDLARELAVLLIKYADDVDDCAFVDSPLGTRYAGPRGIDDDREIAAAEGRPFVCGTRRVECRGPRDYRVVCATCGAGGRRKYGTEGSAETVAVDRSAASCHTCGAS